MSGKRLLLTLLMTAGLNGVLFFQGCDQKELRVTLGCVFPCAELTVTEVKLSSGSDPPEILLPTRVVSWSPLLLVVNLAAAFGVAFWLEHARLRHRFLGSVRVAFWFAFALFNSFVVFILGWFWTVLYPTIWLTGAAIWVLTLGRTTEDSDLARQVVPLTSRLYFVVVVVVVGGLLALVRARMRRRERATDSGGSATPRS